MLNQTLLWWRPKYFSIFLLHFLLFLVCFSNARDLGSDKVLNTSNDVYAPNLQNVDAALQHVGGAHASNSRPGRKPLKFENLCTIYGTQVQTYKTHVQGILK